MGYNDLSDIAVDMIANTLAGLAWLAEIAILTAGAWALFVGVSTLGQQL